MKKVFFVLLLVALGSLLMAQSSIFMPSGTGLNFSGNSLLNPYKLKISHSAGFTAGSSSNGHGFYESRYTNHIAYQFNPKLDLNVDLNFVNFGTASMNKNFAISSNDDNRSKILPEFSLQWKPSDNMSLRLEYKNVNANPFYCNSNDWWRN